MPGKVPGHPDLIVRTVELLERALEGIWLVHSPG